MKYQFIEQHQQEFPVVTMCRTRSPGKWLLCMEQAPAAFDANEKMLSSLPRFGKSFSLIARCTGVRAFMPNAKSQGVHCARKRIARLMREHGITPKRKRCRGVTTNRQHENPVAPHLLQRDCTAPEPNTKWVTDITYLPTAQGWLSLAVVLDVYSRLVVGWSMSAHCDARAG